MELKFVEQMKPFLSIAENLKIGNIMKGHKIDLILICRE